MPLAPAVQARHDLAERLRGRAPEIEGEVMTRVFAIADPDPDPAYAEGLRTAVCAATAYAIEIVERGEEHAPPPPPILLAQARLAARAGVGLDTVLRRYCAGQNLLPTRSSPRPSAASP